MINMYSFAAHRGVQSKAGGLEMPQYNQHGNGHNRNERDRSADTKFWIWTTILLCVFPPVGVIMLLSRILNLGKRGVKRHPYDEARYGADLRNAAQKQARESVTFHAKQTAKEHAQETVDARFSDKKTKKKVRDPLAKMNRTSTALTVTGTVFTAIFGLALLISVASFLYQPWHETMIAALVVSSFFAGSVGLLWGGLHLRKKARKFKQYLTMIGKRQSISIPSLSNATGRTDAAVIHDLEDMLEESIFESGYINYGRNMLVLSGEEVWDTPREKEPQKKTVVPEVSQENAILTEIREVNDAIDHPGLSEQIDHIGVITAKIFDYQKKNPERSPQLHSFLSYYLPTTLKILRAYAQLEAQEVGGANISAAMERIEDMMDKVVEGFEKQLDQLFASDAMDITTDVQVLEQMLAKDGLAGGDNMGITLEL